MIVLTLGNWSLGVGGGVTLTQVTHGACQHRRVPPTLGFPLPFSSVHVHED